MIAGIFEKNKDKKNPTQVDVHIIQEISPEKNSAKGARVNKALLISDGSVIPKAVPTEHTVCKKIICLNPLNCRLPNLVRLSAQKKAK